VLSSFSGLGGLEGLQQHMNAASHSPPEAINMARALQAALLQGLAERQELPQRRELDNRRAMPTRPQVREGRAWSGLPQPASDEAPPFPSSIPSDGNKDAQAVPMYAAADAWHLPRHPMRDFYER
jgi:hypothetical protein